MGDNRASPVFDAGDDLECPHCGTGLSNLACKGCGARFEHVLGVPFLGSFEAEDALGLIEIAANAPNRSNLPLPPGMVERVDALCAAYHEATDKAAFVAGNEEARAGWFLNRYSEWLEVTTLAADLPLAGKRVLDIGAGLGFDSHRLHLRGAEVTALEFSPLLVEAGRKSYPHVRWFGGFSHALPFKSGSFDAVFCNAALHHMRDIPAAIAEGLRVLRPGGVMITTCDSFRPEGSDWRRELAVFDRDEAVLMGVNEQIPPFDAFVETPLANATSVGTELYTHVLYGGRSGREADLHDFVRWETPRDLAWLRQRAGALAMRLTLREAWPHRRRLQTAGALAPVEFASWLDDQSLALSKLAAVLPAQHVDAPFPGRGTKFDLLNGWRRPKLLSFSRQGYKRARWFLRRDRRRNLLSFELNPGAPADFSVLLGGRKVVEKRCQGGWERFTVMLDEIPEGAVFAVEIRRESPAASFEEGCFSVRARKKR